MTIVKHLVTTNYSMIKFLKGSKTKSINENKPLYLLEINYNRNVNLTMNVYFHESL